MEQKSVFETLFEVNINDYVEKKKDLLYLSWACAWAFVLLFFNNAFILFFCITVNLTIFTGANLFVNMKTM